MSIHVVSAVLKCRDKQLTSSRRMVLVCLANFAGEDGKSWPSQQLIADESGCGLRSVKDHIKWLDLNGFLTRTTKKLGQGNGSRTSYNISLKRLIEGTTDRGEEIAGANNARAKSVSSECSILPLTNRQEPSIDNSSELSSAHAPPERIKPPPKKKKSQRPIPKDWQPTDRDIKFALKNGLSQNDIRIEASRFLAHHTSKQRKYVDHEACWQTWLIGPYGIVTKRAERRSQQGSRGYGAPVEDKLAAIDEVFGTMASDTTRNTDRRDYSEGASAGDIIDAEPVFASGVR